MDKGDYKPYLLLCRMGWGGGLQEQGQCLFPRVHLCKTRRTVPGPRAAVQLIFPENAQFMVEQARTWPPDSHIKCQLFWLRVGVGNRNSYVFYVLDQFTEEVFAGLLGHPKTFSSGAKGILLFTSNWLLGEIGVTSEEASDLSGVGWVVDWASESPGHSNSLIKGPI